MTETQYQCVFLSLVGLIALVYITRPTDKLL